MKKIIIFLILFVILIIGGSAIYWYINNQAKSTKISGTCGVDKPITYCSGEKVCYGYCNDCECRGIQCINDSNCQKLYKETFSEGIRNSLKECGNKEVVTYCSNNKLCSAVCNICGCQSVTCYSDSNCASKPF
ncbi:MAG: hypothetical protein GYA31_00360 [Parcubacteria group bacterium]|nr:hypothetical protein [Parcubacteria group bacterium]